MQNVQSVEANGTQPVKRLDGEITKLGEIPFSAGTWFEVWVGLWERCEKGGGGKGNREAIGGDGVGDKGVVREKVSRNFTTSILSMTSSL